LNKNGSTANHLSSFEQAKAEDPFVLLSNRLEKLERSIEELTRLVRQGISTHRVSVEGSFLDRDATSPGEGNRSASSSTPYSPRPFVSAYHGVEQNCLISTRLNSLGWLLGQARPAELEPLAYDDSEAILDREARQGQALFNNAWLTSASDLDLSPRTCWRLQQNFVRNVLPWIPLFDQQTCVSLVTDTAEKEFSESNTSTTLVLFILALGAISRGEHYTGDTPSEFLGLQYFHLASHRLAQDEAYMFDLRVAQCFVLKALYLLYCLRPVQAFQTIHAVSTIVIGLLQMRNRLAVDHSFRESCHRVYWACYILEHELKAYVSHSAHTIASLHEKVPLPLSDHDEPGIFWFLSAIALRRIFTHIFGGSEWTYATVYAPIVSKELTAQLTEWYAHLPPSVRFPLGPGLMLDGHKSFLKTQYYSALCVVNWPAVVRASIHEPETEEELTSVLEEAGRIQEFAVAYIEGIGGLLQERHPLLFANLTG
jgi:hypothetical protein